MISYIRREGYGRIVACKKWPECVKARISYLKTFHRIYIHPRCPRIAQEGKLWSWKVNKNNEVIVPNILVPGYDHGWDAVGYGLEAHVLGFTKTVVDEPEEVEFPNMPPMRKSWMS
jgi:phage terminase large subunit